GHAAQHVWEPRRRQQPDRQEQRVRRRPVPTGLRAQGRQAGRPGAGHRLSVYATNATLDSTHVAAQYGFTVSGDGVGTAAVNVGSNGDAFGVANNTMLTVMDLLLATDAQAVNGVLYGGNTTKRTH